MTWPCPNCEPQMDAQFAYARELIAERDRYRVALERIADYPASVSYPEKWVHWAAQAREALNGETTERVET